MLREQRAATWGSPVRKFTLVLIAMLLMALLPLIIGVSSSTSLEEFRSARAPVSALPRAASTGRVSAKMSRSSRIAQHAPSVTKLKRRTVTPAQARAHVAAEARIEQSLPEIFEQGYDVNLPMGRIIGTPNPDTVVMDVANSKGQLQRVYSQGAFGVERGGKITPIDTALHEIPGGWAPNAARYNTRLPLSYATGFQWDMGGAIGEVSITPRDASRGAIGQLSGRDHIVYPSVWPQTDVVATSMVDGVVEHFVARSDDAPRAYSWNVGLPAGASLVMRASDVYVVSGSSEALLTGMPLALDSDGAFVSAFYEISQRGDASVLTLHWSSELEGGRQISYPVDVDPEYEIAATATTITPEIASGTSDGLGVTATCDTENLEIRFTGSTLGRTFNGSTAASAACSIPGPTTGVDWFSLEGDFLWHLDSDQRIRLSDQAWPNTYPEDSNSDSLESFVYTGAGHSTGASDLLWDEDQPDGVPTGAVRFSLAQITSGTLGAGTSGTRAARLENIVRTFTEDAEPALSSVAPTAPFAGYFKPGSRTLSISATDAGSGCVGSGGTVEVTGPADDVVYSSTLTNCAFSASPTFTTPGRYDVSFSVEDLAGNELVVETSFAVADPIAAPETSDVIFGEYDIDTEIASDLAAGTAQLYGVSAGGVEFAIDVPITTIGEVPRTWNTLNVQNGTYTLRLDHTVGATTTTLETVTVAVANARPMMSAPPATASGTGVGGGMTVLHLTGAISGQFPDVTQKGAGGIEFGVGRSYHSQDKRPSLIGAGWRTSYEQRIVTGDDAFVTYTDATGREWAYAPNILGGFDPAPGQEGLLRLNPDPLTLTTYLYQIVYPNGRILNFSASNGRLARESWPAGQGINYGAIVASAVPGEQEFVVSDDEGHEIKGILNTTGQLRLLTNSIGKSWIYRYDAGRLDEFEDPTGAITEYTYASGVISGVLPPQNRDIAITSEPFINDAGEELQRITDVADPLSVNRAFDFSVDGEVTETIGTHETVSVVDVLGRTDVFTNALGDPITYTYDAAGRITSATDENAEPTNTTFNSGGCKTKDIDAESHETTYSSFDNFCNPRTVEDAAGKFTYYTYDGYGNKLTMTDADAKVTTWTYDVGSPLPVTMDPPAGAIIHYEYDATGQISDQYWVDGLSVEHHVERATFDDAGQRVTTRAGDIAATTFTYDEAGRPERTTDPLGDYTENTYNGSGDVTASLDKNGGLTEYGYDERGNQVSVENPLNKSTLSSYDAYGDMQTSTDELAKVTNYDYDKGGNELTVEDPLSRITTNTYDKAGNQLTEQLPGESTATSTFVYDDNGSELSETHIDASTRLTSYTDLTNTHVETDELGHLTTHGYDDVGRETTIANGEGEVDETFYDDAGRVEARENGLDQRTEYTLDAVGRITVTENADTTTQLAEWDDAGRQTSVTDANGEETVLSYDAVGNVLSELKPDGGLWQYTYDGNGNKLTVENPSNQVTISTYDANNRLETNEDAEGGTTTYTYDDAGRLVESEDPVGKITSYGYDFAGQRTSMTDPTSVVTTYSYTARGELEDETRDGITTSYTYDNRGNLETVTKGSSVTTYDYDAAGQLTDHEMPDGSTLAFTYDDAGRKLSEVHSVRGTTSWTYDAAGRIGTMVTSAGTTTYTRDAMGRVTGIAYPGSITVAYTYDDAGNLETITDAGGTRSMGHDEVGRVTSFTTLRGRSGTRTYDDNGRVTASSLQTLTTTTPTTTNSTYSYDSAGRLTSYNTGFGTIGYTYTADGHVATKTFPGSTVITNTWDSKGRLKTQQITGQNKFTYTYDDLDRVTVVEETVSSTLTPYERYAYDADGRLLTWWSYRDYFRTNYVYDANGNLDAVTRQPVTSPSGTNTGPQDTQMAACYTNINSGSCGATIKANMQGLSNDIPNRATNPASPANATYAQILRYMYSHPYTIVDFVHNSAGQVTSRVVPADGVAATAFTWDTRGNESKEGSTYTRSFDYDNRMTVRKTGSGTTDKIQYFYTSDGLIWKTISALGVTNYWDWDDQNRLISVDAGAGAKRNLFYDQQGMAGQNVPGSITGFNYYNHRGDVRAVVNASTGAITSTFWYSPFGAMNSSLSGNFGTANAFSWDGVHATYGLINQNEYWMRARSYNMDTMRFRQADPLPAQEGATDTTYSYASNDPINRTDPMGTVSLPSSKTVYSSKKFCGLNGQAFQTYRDDKGWFPKVSYKFGCQNWSMEEWGDLVSTNKSVQENTMKYNMCVVELQNGRRTWKYCNRGIKRAFTFRNGDVGQLCVPNGDNGSQVCQVAPLDTSIDWDAMQGWVPSREWRDDRRYRFTISTSAVSFIQNWTKYVGSDWQKSSYWGRTGRMTLRVETGA